MVTAELPSGWSLVTGTDMNGDDMADFICHAEKFEYGDPYLQVEEYPRDPTVQRRFRNPAIPMKPTMGKKS